MVNIIVVEPEVKKEYVGKVTKIINCGAIVEILPGKEGLLHISKISKQRLEKVEDVLAIGDTIKVTVTEVDKESGKFNLINSELLNKKG